MPSSVNLEQYLNIQEITASLKVSKSTLWRWIKQGLFPRPVRLGPKAVRWRESDIAAWDRERTAAEASARANE